MVQLNIEVIYAIPEEQILISMSVENGINIEKAILKSGILSQYPEIDLTVNKVGIFSKVAKLTDILREGDRVEIYRALIADPKEARKKKALKQSK